MQTASQPLARSPLHAWHAAHEARFEERDGAQVVLAYAAVEQEMTAIQAGLGLVDLSAFAKVLLVGNAVPAWVARQLGDSPASGPRGVAFLPGPGRELACRLTQDRL